MTKESTILPEISTILKINIKFTKKSQNIITFPTFLNELAFITWKAVNQMAIVRILGTI